MAAVGETHDVKVAGHFLRLMPRGYRRRAAPVRGARISTGDYGYGDLSIWQRWHQFCWNGGMSADKWVDDAMYYYGVGVDATVQDRLVLSPDLQESNNTNLYPRDLGFARQYFTWRTKEYARRLYSISETTAGEGATLYKYQDWDDTWVVEQHWGDGKQARSWATFGGDVVIGFLDGVMKHTDTPNNNSSWENIQPPSGANGKGIHAMFNYNGRLYVAYGDKVYRYKKKDNGDWVVDGGKVFYNPEGSSNIVAMEEHLGFLYMASQDGHIHRTDSNNTFDIWQWDGGTSIKALRSFDGRLFVGTYEYNDDATVGHQGIYQFTGSAVTQLKKWGQGDKASIMGNFTEYDRKLFYGAPGLWGLNTDDLGNDVGGFGVAVFDPIEDAHSIWSTNKDTAAYPDASGTGKDWVVDDVIFWNGYLHASVRGFGNFRTKVKYRDTRDEEGDFDVVGPSNAGYLISSNYDAGTPGLTKLWRDCVITATIPENTSVTLHTSVDRGATWTEAGVITGQPGDPERRVTVGLADQRSHQLMYRIALDSTDATRSPVITGITFAYLPIAEPNWVWDLTLSLSNRVKLLDGTSEVVDVHAIRDELADLFRNQSVTDFIDVDGSDWTNAVIIWDFIDDAYIPANAVDPQEVSIRITLLEAQKADEAP